MTSSSTPLPQQTPAALQKLVQCGDAVVPCKGGGRVKLTDINPHLVCVLCHGYFVDATSIVECLHSFCRSCIVLHLDKKNFCPICQEEIQNIKALKPDKALQDIVYKLVPGLFHSEMKRRQEFYQKHPHRDMHLHPESRGLSVDRIVYTADEMISLSLEYYDKECEQEMWKNVTDNRGLQYIVRTEKPQRCVVRKRYLKCPAAVRMSHLKKFIRLKYNLKPTDIVELLYRRESLPDEYSIMDIAYIYTWNRNEPMRFFYKINARVVVPIIPNGNRLTSLTELKTSEPGKFSNLNPTGDTTPLLTQVKDSSSPVAEMTSNPSAMVGMTKEENTNSILETSTAKEPLKVEIDKLSDTESILKDPTMVTVKGDLSKKDCQSPPPPPVVSTIALNPPISPEGTSRKENVSDNVRNSCANEPAKSAPAVAIISEEKKSVDQMEHQQIGTTTEVPMKKLEKLVDQQQQVAPITISTTSVTTTTSPPSAIPLPKKLIGVEDSKLNMSINKLHNITSQLMYNQNSVSKCTVQQMQQIGMYTSIPTFKQQLSAPQPNVYIRPGFPGMHPYKRPPDLAPARSQAPTNRPPFIPVRKSYEWNKARNLAAKPPQSPVAAKDNKTNEKSLTAATEKPLKKEKVDKSSKNIVITSCLSAKNSDEMSAAQSLLKVGQDLRLPKPPIMTDLHDKYNCESSLQITKVTEPETNQPPSTAHEKHSNSQPSLQIMRVPTAADKSTKPAATESGHVPSSVNTTVVTNKPVNKKPVPSLYSMPTKRMKEDHHHHNNGTDNKRIERRVDTENGVLSVSLLTETSKLDMDAKRREVVQPDVSIKLMTFPTEQGKKTLESSPIPGSGGGVGHQKRKSDELNSACGGGTNKRVKQDELNLNATGGANNNNNNNNKRKHEEVSPIIGGGCNANKRKQDEPTPHVNGVNSNKKHEVVSPVGCNSSGGSTNKRKQDSPERKVTPPKPSPTCKDDVPQLIEINSSPYAKLLPAKKQQPLLPKKLPLSCKRQPSPKRQQQKLQPAAAAVPKVLDLSKSPPNGVVKRPLNADVEGRCSPSSNVKAKTTSSPTAQQLAPSPTMSAAAAVNSMAAAASINPNMLFAAQRQAAILWKQHFDMFNNGLMRNGGKAPTEWPRPIFNPDLFYKK